MTGEVEAGGVLRSRWRHNQKLRGVKGCGLFTGEWGAGSVGGRGESKGSVGPKSVEFTGK